MKKPILVGLALIPPLLLGGLALAQSAGVNSLRGAEVDEPAGRAVARRPPAVLGQ